jgi:hypothetical protein
MTPIEHYREAERLAAQIDAAADWQPLALVALVHALLALAAGPIGIVPQ